MKRLLMLGTTTIALTLGSTPLVAFYLRTATKLYAFARAAE